MSSKPVNPKMIVVVAAFAAFLATFNETYLNIAFTPIMESLGVGVSTVQWLATAYMLGAAIMVPVAAFLYRSIPTKTLFLVTTGLLIVGSVIAAMASSFPVLLTGRIVQALGTGMLIPVGMNITLEVAPKEKLGTYMGIMGAMTTLGPSLGVIVAGVLLSFFQWNMLLWIFAVLSLLCFLAGALLLGNIAHLTHPKLDMASVIFIGLALIGILYGVSTIFSGNKALALGAAVIGILFLVVFVSRQKKLAEPLLDLRPVKEKAFVLGVALNMLSLIVIFAMNIVMPIFLQSTLGTSSFSASITLFPAILLSCIISPVAGKVYDKHGPRVLLPLGFLLICLFTAGIALFRDSGSLIVLAILYIPVICGSALIIGPVQSFALSHLTGELNPHGVTFMSTGFQIAGCIGSSVFTGVYSATVGGSMAAGAPQYDAASRAFMVAALLASACALVGFLLALRIKDRKREMAAQEAPVTPLRAIMKTDVYTIGVNATLLDALQLITEKKISGVPVVDHTGQPVSFISDGDILRYLSKANPLFINAYSFAAINSHGQAFEEKLRELVHLKVSDIANNKVISVDVNDDLEDICRVLNEQHLKKVPVMENGRMVGIINRSNITKYTLNLCLDQLKANH